MRGRMVMTALLYEQFLKNGKIEVRVRVRV